MHPMSARQDYWCVVSVNPRIYPTSDLLNPVLISRIGKIAASLYEGAAKYMVEAFDRLNDASFLVRGRVLGNVANR
jgi:hypothetical protein